MERNPNTSRPLPPKTSTNGRTRPTNDFQTQGEIGKIHNSEKWANNHRTNTSQAVKTVLDHHHNTLHTSTLHHPEGNPHSERMIQTNLNVEKSHLYLKRYQSPRTKLNILLQWTSPITNNPRPSAEEKGIEPLNGDYIASVEESEAPHAPPGEMEELDTYYPKSLAIFTKGKTRQKQKTHLAHVVLTSRGFTKIKVNTVDEL
uniref:Integrase catalytic domain-containing protein n=1 Tax=Strongyloides papillosus TaxID=174720 RepID=A0A0N5CIP0_STREA